MSYVVIHWPRGATSGTAIAERESERDARAIVRDARTKWPGERVELAELLVERPQLAKER